MARTAKIELRVTPDEKAEIARRATRAGSKTSDWIRSLALADFVGEADAARSLGPRDLRQDSKVREAFVGAREALHRRLHDRATARRMAEEDWERQRVWGVR